MLADAPGGKPDVILIGTGSEVWLCVDAYEKLTAEGVKARVVSMPSWELFDHQPQEYRDSVLPPEVKARVSVEQASTFGWDRYARRRIGMHTFGASAPLKELQKKFGFTPDAVVAAAKEEIAKAVTYEDGDRVRPCRIRIEGDAGETSAGFGRRGSGRRDQQHRSGGLSRFRGSRGLAILDGRADRGVLICGSGVGASVAANKIKGIRAGSVSRHIFGSPGSGARRHECPGAGRARDWAGAGERIS